MKRLLLLMIVLVSFSANAQSNSALTEHYEKFYQQMRTQGDVRGVINALTHLNILAPNAARRDTLAVLYMNDGQHLQALNTVGIEANTNDSDMAVEVKAVSLQALGQAEKAIPHFEELFKRAPNVLIAYELAELKTQVGDLVGATSHITYGIANATDEIKRSYYETQQPYQVPAKAAFTYLKSLVKFKENPTLNKDAAIAILDEAIALAPNFNLAIISKQAIEAQKNAPATKN